MGVVLLILTGICAFAVTAITGIFLIPYLKKLKFGQTILDIGPKWHQNKQGTPTMGGFMFIIGIIVAVVAAMISYHFNQNLFSTYERANTIKVIAGILMALAYGFTGFIDDYIKVVKKRNLGLTASQKLILQIAIAALYLLSLYLFGIRTTIVTIPFIGQLNLGIFYYPFMIFVIVGFVNAVNLTDGIDGLAASVTFMVAVGYMAMSSILMYTLTGLVSMALAGGCLGFLVWNFYPAKVFMGDTGSLFLGGMVVALAFAIGQPLILILVGVVYWIEALSVILQVISYKTTGKRIFKMSPIHHHFEMSGYSEVKIVLIFSIVALLGSVLAVLAIFRL